MITINSEMRPGSITIGVTDSQQINMSVRATDFSTQMEMKPAYARWLASEILAAADRAENKAVAPKAPPVAPKAR